MEYITTTNLRTKSSQLVDSLKKGTPVSLIHRSQIIGTIQPAKKKTVAITDIKALKKFLESIRPLKPTTQKERERIYRQHLMKKYGQSLSRR